MTTAVAPREDRVAFYVRQARESMWAALAWRQMEAEHNDPAFRKYAAHMADRARFLLEEARNIKELGQNYAHSV